MIPRASPDDGLRRSPDREWSVEEAEARFGEVVRNARSETPPGIFVRGRDTAVVISTEDFDRLQPRSAAVTFVAFMESLAADGLDLTRHHDIGRDLAEIVGPDATITLLSP